MPYWHGKNSCCYLCKASKNRGPFYFGDFRRGAWRRRGRRSFAEYLASFAGATPPPLTNILGFTLEMVTVDFLHCDHLGVASWLAGNALVRAAELKSQGVAGSWANRMESALRLIHHQFVEWSIRNGVQHSEREFPLPRLSVGSRNNQWPEFKGKAHNTAVVCKFLAHYFESEPGLDLQGDLLLRNALLGWGGVQNVMHAAGPTFADEQASKILNDGMM
eukprot:2770232-Pyramimonas_sp.AAC.1